MAATILPTEVTAGVAGAGFGPVAVAAYCPHTPTLFEEELHGATRRALNGLAPLFKGADAVVVASPHWVGRGSFLVQASARPRCIQDYYGFPERYYDFRYEPPGHPELAAAIAAEARRAAEAAGVTLAVIATGSPGHRLDRVTWARHGPYPEGEEFDRRLIAALTRGHPEEIAAIEPRLWQAAAPEGFLAPLYILLGALGWDGGGGASPPRTPETQDAPAAGPLRAELLAYERAFTAVSLATLLFRAA